MHDVVAELEGYRNELAEAQRHGRSERADAVQEQLGRVKTEVEARAVAAETRSASLKADGQDVASAHADVEARHYREALAPFEDTSESAPKERAVPRKAVK
jgi:hypothetical protein